MAVTKRDGSKFWYIQFQFNGKTFIKSSKTTDKQLAHDLESQWRMQLIKQHQLGTKAPIDIPKAFQIFTNSKKDIKTHPRLVSYCSYAIKYWSHLEHIHHISTEEIEQYRNHLHSIGLSNATIKHKLHPVGATIKYAKKLGYQTSEVEIPRVKVSKGRLRYLTEGEEQKLLSEIDPYRHVEGMPPFKQRNGIVKQQMIDLHHLIILLLDTGARHSEICNLKWENIDLEKKTIALWRSKVQNESVLYMTDRVVNVLSERYSRRVSNFIFTSKQGNARRTLTHVIQRAFKRAGLEGCSAHTLRHTHATRLIQNGLNLYEIKEILGHADIQTTMRYAHIEQEQVSRKAVKVINNFNIKHLTPTDLPSK